MPEPPDDAPAAAAIASPRDRVQCPNCCQYAPVTSREMGLLFYRCELCGAMGAASREELVESPGPLEPDRSDDCEPE